MKLNIARYIEWAAANSCVTHSQHIHAHPNPCVMEVRCVARHAYVIGINCVWMLLFGISEHTARRNDCWCSWLVADGIAVGKPIALMHVSVLYIYMCSTHYCPIGCKCNFWPTRYCVCARVKGMQRARGGIPVCDGYYIVWVCVSLSILDDLSVAQFVLSCYNIEKLWRAGWCHIWEEGIWNAAHILITNIFNLECDGNQKNGKEIHGLISNFKMYVPRKRSNNYLLGEYVFAHRLLLH